MSGSRSGSCNLTKYVKVGRNKWRYCRVARGSTGRVKPDHVLVDGRIEVHPEGFYSIEWYESAKRRRISVGKNAAQAQQAQEHQSLLLRARAHGVAVKDESSELTLADACAEFLDECLRLRDGVTPIEG